MYIMNNTRSQHSHFVHVAACGRHKERTLDTAAILSGLILQKGARRADTEAGKTNLGIFGLPHRVRTVGEHLNRR